MRHALVMSLVLIAALGCRGAGGSMDLRRPFMVLPITRFDEGLEAGVRLMRATYAGVRRRLVGATARPTETDKDGASMATMSSGGLATADQAVPGRKGA